jgi:hypothetical protein
MSEMQGGMLLNRISWAAHPPDPESEHLKWVENSLDFESASD